MMLPMLATVDIMINIRHIAAELQVGEEYRRLGLAGDYQ